jgi:hypothetical protein
MELFCGIIYILKQQANEGLLCITKKAKAIFMPIETNWNLSVWNKWFPLTIFLER